MSDISLVLYESSLSRQKQRWEVVPGVVLQLVLVKVVLGASRYVVMMRGLMMRDVELASSVV